MSTLFLHIGTPKTGTTSLQQFLFQNNKTLETFGFSFPTFPLSFPNIRQQRNGRFLIARFFTQNDVRDYEKEHEIENTGYQLLLEQLSRYDNVILSEESIWHACDHKENFWWNLDKILKKNGHNLKIIVYLRRQDLFVQSYWLHKVREQETLTFQEYISKKKYKFCHLDYYEHLENIAFYVGKENIIVRVYENQQYEGNDHSIFSDFLHILNIPMTEQFKVPSLLYNTSIDPICAETKRLLNNMPEFSEKNYIWLNRLRDLSQDNKEAERFFVPSLFTKEELDAFYCNFEEGNKKIAQEYLHRLDGNLFQEPFVYNDHHFRFSTSELITNCGHLFLLLDNENIALKQEIMRLEKERSNLFFSIKTVKRLFKRLFK